MTDNKEAWQEPAENPESHKKLVAFLKEKGVDFKVTEHKAVLTSEEAAEVRGVSIASGAKAILLKDTGKKLALEGVPFYLAVQGADKKFASKTFKKLINSKGIRFATPQEVWETTGCLPGAVAPFGKIFGVPTWVDRSLSKQESINFNVGLRTHSVSMSYADYFAAEEPKFHVFSDEEIALGDIPKDDAVEAPKKNDREAKKQERLAQRQKKVEVQAQTIEKDPNDPSAHLFGEKELNRSQGDPELRFTKEFTHVQDVNEALDGKTITVRGRLHGSRAAGGNLLFIKMR